MSIAAPSAGETRLNRIVATVRQLCEGRSNSTGIVTLIAGATNTIVLFGNCGPGSVVALSPRSASAAAAEAWISSVSAGSFTIAHAASGATDQVMGFACVG